MRVGDIWKRHKRHKHNFLYIQIVEITDSEIIYQGIGDTFNDGNCCLASGNNNNHLFGEAYKPVEVFECECGGRPIQDHRILRRDRYGLVFPGIWYKNEKCWGCL